MLTPAEENTVTEKTRDLCAAILAQPTMTSARQQIDTFLGNDEVRGQYEQLVGRGRELQQKQQSGAPLSDDEITQFQEQQEQVLQNPVARGFIDAQQLFQSIHHSVLKYVSMTLENGRVPTPEDIEEASCGHGCNCHH